MNTLISGGTGLMGRALAESLLADGHAVWILTRDPLKAKIPAGAEAIAWDGQTTVGWGDRMELVDAVVHLAAMSIGELPWSPRVRSEIISSRVETGQALLSAVSEARRKPAVFLQISGSGYYGISETAVMTEESPPGAGFQTDVTLAWEGTTQPVADLGVRHVIARTAPVLDPKEGILPPVLLQFKLLVGGTLGSGRQWFSWIHLRDQVAALRFLLSRVDASGPFNLSAPNPVTNHEMAQIVARVTGRPSWFRIPGFAMRAVLGSMSTLVLDGQKVLPCRLEEMGFEFQFPELEPALRDLLGKDKKR